jgi:hypothetical protein
MTTQIYIDHIEKCIQDAELYKSNVIPEILGITGFTGHKALHFYNNLLNFHDARYLEIGTWYGSSSCAAMYKNKSVITCIDNWSEFMGPKNECLANIERYKGENTVDFIEKDCWTIQNSELKKYNMYMYDACHFRESHAKALTHYVDVMDDIFIYLVDDWDWKKVQNGTYDAIESLGLKILYKRDIHMIEDGTDEPCASSKSDWWNGIGIFVFSKN